jgi:hypothetical protein
VLPISNRESFAADYLPQVIIYRESGFIANHHLSRTKDTSYGCEPKERLHMHKRMPMILGSGFLLIAGYLAGTHGATVAHAQAATQEAAPKSYARIEGIVPKSYGRLAAAISDSIGTGLVFEGTDGTIRFVSVTGMKEGELARYDKTPTHGGIPRSYGHLVSAVVNNGATGLVFEDANGVIRFVTLTGVTESELTRE